MNGSPDLQWPKNRQDVKVDSPQGWLLSTKFNPRSLTDLCRLRIRKDLGAKVSEVVPELPIPKTLQQFLMLEGIANEVNLDLIPFAEG